MASCQSFAADFIDIEDDDSEDSDSSIKSLDYEN